MLDYVFFHEKPYRAFRDFLDARAIAYQESEAAIGLTISLESPPPEAVLAEIDRYYDELTALQERLLDEGGEDFGVINLRLADGKTVFVPVDPDVLERVLGVISEEELAELIAALVRAVEAERDEGRGEGGAEGGPPED